MPIKNCDDLFTKKKSQSTFAHVRVNRQLSCSSFPFPKLSAIRLIDTWKKKAKIELFQHSNLLNMSEISSADIIAIQNASWYRNEFY